MIIKAMTLHQPFAHAMALGMKKIETRPWKTNYRGLLAIHASKQKGTFGLPLGCVQGVCRLVDVVLMTRENMPDKNTDEYGWGNFVPGRYMWITTDFRRINPPIPARGMQGLWNWDCPEGLLP